MKPKRIKYIRFLPLILLTTVLATAILLILIQNERTYRWEAPVQSAHSATLRVVGDIDCAPISFLDENGNPSGHNVELVYILGEMLGYTVEIDLLPWNEALERFRADEYDLLISTTFTLNRSDWVTYSIPILHDSTTVFGRNAANFSTPQLQTARLATLQGDVINDVLRESYQVSGNVTQCPTYADCFQAVISGACDYVLAPSTIGFYTLRNMEERGDIDLSYITSFGGTIHNGIFCIGMRPDAVALTAQIDNALNTLTENGELGRLNESWTMKFTGQYRLSNLIHDHPYLIMVSVLSFLFLLSTMLLFIQYQESRRLVRQNAYESEMHKLRAQIEVVLRGISGGFAIVRDDKAKTFVYIGPSLAALGGYTPEEFLNGRLNSLAAIMAEEDLPLMDSEEIVTLAPDDSFSIKFRIRCKDGSLKWISSHGKLIRSEEGERQFYAFNHDITELEEARQHLEESTALLRQEQQMYRNALLHECSYAYTVNVTEDRIHSIHTTGFLERYDFVTDLPYDEAIQRMINTMKPVFLTGSDDFYLTDHLTAAYEQGKRMIENEYYIPDTGEYKKTTTFLSRDDDTNTMYGCVVGNDVTEQHREELETRNALSRLTEVAIKVAMGNLDIDIDIDAKGDIGILADMLQQMLLNLRWHVQQLNQRALQDALTGVKNKRAWQEALLKLDESIQRGDAHFAIAVCDVNNLKQMNDVYGHEAGDQLLQAACQHICGIFKRSPVYRIGGDEFTVILEKADLAMQDQLVQSFWSTMGMNAAQPDLSIALGLAFYGPGDETANDVFRRADTAMYEKKTRMKALKALQQEQENKNR